MGRLGRWHFQFAPVADAMTASRNMNNKARRRRRVALIDRDGNRCQHCGEHGGFRRTGRGVLLTIDHIIPLAQGGTHDLTNLQLLCLDCNQRKADGTDTLARLRAAVTELDPEATS